MGLYSETSFHHHKFLFTIKVAHCIVASMETRRSICLVFLLISAVVTTGGEFLYDIFLTDFNGAWRHALIRWKALGMRMVS